MKDSGKSGTFTVPGNLLIAGEYLVTEEGGRGLAVAAGPRARLTCEPSENPRVESRWPGGESEWIRKDRIREMTSGNSVGPKTNLVDAVFTTASEFSDEIEFPDLHLEIDTRGFARKDGSKSGFGSSAAAAVLLTYALLKCRDASTANEGQIREKVARTALTAHRLFQNGRGSGYDIYASTLGGTGIFTGGKEPTWKNTAWPADVEGWILSGQPSINSPNAIGRYTSWKELNRSEVEVFHLRYEQAMEEFLGTTDTGCTDSSEFIRTLKNMAQLGVELGEKIGVSSKPGLLDSSKGFPAGIQQTGLAVKCLGAGNELTLIAGLKDQFTKNVIKSLKQMESSGLAQRLRVDDEGLREDSI